MTKAERQSFWERNRKSGGYLLRKRVRGFLYRFARAILIFGLCFMIVQPLLNKLSVTLRSEGDLYDMTIISIPRHFSTESYSFAWKMMTATAAFKQSILLAIGVSLSQVLSCTLIGYGFARFKFPFKKFLFACVILTIIVPPTTLTTPLYLYVQRFDIFGIFKAILGKPINMYGKALPYILMCLTGTGYKSGLYIYLLRQHFRNEPKELEEAAYVDGCGKLRTFFQILLPGAVPIMVSVGLFAFVWQWTDKIYAKVFFPTTSGWVLISERLYNIAGSVEGYYRSVYGEAAKAPQAFTNWITAAGVLITLVPLLIIYVFAQKNFVESISQSGIKG
ncbi:MAG: carbohydrate ABC transporter permease [Lachnospiraceae bacterium]|nr:carbohydrate ABC transporter permease [Lachnospiraceae bacterium]